MSACAVTAQDREAHPRIASYAIAQDQSTSLGRSLIKDAKAHPGQSGFLLLDNARDSLKIRLAMVEAAERTIDLQYYILHDDVASNLMLEALLRAAERGVRVRLLIDGISLGEAGENLAILDNQPNIQIRVFNPIVKPTIPLLSKLRIGLPDLERFTRRMHNKALISDNHLAVTGGRNLGDEYFDDNPDFNFKDLDTLSVGPITDRISKSFDKFWNDDQAYLIADLRPFNTDPEKLKELRRTMKASWAEKMDATGSTLHMERLADRLIRGDVPLIWAKSELSVDGPEKMDGEAVVDSKPKSRLEDLTAKGEKEFLAVSAYFVPGDDGVAWLKSMVDRGMTVKVLTNSLAATDVVAVHSGYSKYREDIIRAGIDLYEFKPIAGEKAKQRPFGSSAPPTASLHSKLYIIDRKDVVVGSYNLDPRSDELNTELAIIIHSEALATQAVKLFERSTAPNQSYQVVLQNDELRWVTEENSAEKIYKSEPEVGIRKLQARLMGFLPIEDQL